VTITFSADVPGDVQSTTSLSSDSLVWAVPMDGSPVDVATLSELKDPRNIWAGPVAKASLIALLVWIVVSVGFIIYVIIARRRRAAMHALR
jgi:hypothetical protein